MARASLEIGNSNQELMEKSKRKKWKVWLGAITLFFIIIILVAAAIVLLSGTSDEENNERPTPIPLKSVLNGTLQPNRFNATWISDDQLLYLSEDNDLKLYDAKNKKHIVLIGKNNPLSQISFDHQISADQKFLLFAYNYRKHYRHSYSAMYMIIDIETSEHVNVHTDKDAYLELVIWGPQNNSLIYVKNNNIYYKSSAIAVYQQLTFDGLPGVVYNGVPDWVYEEEILTSNRAIWFSGDGSHLVYAKFNDSLTKAMTIPYYGNPGSIEYQYVKAFSVKYPKVGTENPEISLFKVALTDSVSTTTELEIPDKLDLPILASVSFANSSGVAVIWTNRIQNEFIITMCDEICKEIYSYKEKHGWVDMLRPLIFNSKGNASFAILPKAIDNDSWRQIVLFKETNEDLWDTEFITNSKNNVIELVYYDESLQKIWFMATSVNDSAYQHLYTATLDGQIDCFTCKIKHSSGSECLYNEVSMSKDGSYLSVSCMGPQIPEIYLYTKNGEKLLNWDLNEQITEQLKDISLPVIKRMTVQVAPKPLPPAQVLLMTPMNADLSGNLKYPMLVNVYAGPDSAQVLEKWSLDWGASLVTRYNIIIALIDGRGSSLKGNNNLFAGYRQLGSVEIDDQINVTRRLQQNLKYIDANRTCIWGWSYGGYASALALARGEGTFKCAISVAPVTDWLYYDSMYTERYMGLPILEDNLLGYQKSQLNTIKNTLAIGTKKFMLVHGTMDDNVHFQQSMMLSRMLQLNDVLFTQLSYPDEDHGLTGVKKHFYHSIEQFLQTNLITDD